MAVCLATTPFCDVSAQTLDSQQRALDEITSVADSICNIYKAEGTSEGTKVTGEVKAQLSGLAKRLADLGINGQGQYNTESYAGVLQSDLPNVLKNNADCKLQVLHILSDRMLSKEAGKGGDTSGSGGAGGGAAGSGAGGNSTGTGGAGGGGSFLGGGGGGGGEGAQGGAGGLGGGGGGGGKGAPGGAGGPGGLIIRYVPIKEVSVPQTLYQLYQLDAYALGFVGRGNLIWSAPNGRVEIEINLSWGPECGPTSLWFYVPATRYPYEASEQPLTAYRQALRKFDMQTKLPAQSGCKSMPTSSPERRFSGKIYIYSDTDLPTNKIRSIQKKYTRNKLSVEFRGDSYLKTERKQWTTKTARSPNEVVIMMVGDEAP